ncbi:hypothetical protein Tco_1382744 [Tanacetum coccineum]
MKSYNGLKYGLLHPLFRIIRIRYEALNDDYGELYQSHHSCQDVSDRLTDTQNQLLDAIRSRSKLSDDHKILQQEHLRCAGKEVALVEKLDITKKEKGDLLDKSREQEERIRHLEEALASKMSSLSEVESTASTLKGDLERLTMDLSHYKKSLSDVFNQSIAAGWSEGVKVEHFVEDAEAILAAVTDYDPECKSTFMSAFDALFTKSYPYVEKIDLSFRLPLGDLQNMWPKGEGPTIEFVSDLRTRGTIIRRLAIGTWTHLESLAFWEILLVTWPLELGLIPNILRFGEYCSSLGHWHLDLSLAFFA